MDVKLTEFAHLNPDVPANTLAAANLLIRAVADDPISIARGYWPTVSLVWALDDSKLVEVEVGSTDFEYYGGGDRMDIRHFPHEGSNIVPKALLELLPHGEREGRHRAK